MDVDASVSELVFIAPCDTQTVNVAVRKRTFFLGDKFHPIRPSGTVVPVYDVLRYRVEASIFACQWVPDYFDLAVVCCRAFLDESGWLQRFSLDNICQTSFRQG